MFSLPATNIFITLPTGNLVILSAFHVYFVQTRLLQINKIIKNCILQHRLFLPAVGALHFRKIPNSTPVTNSELTGLRIRNHLQINKIKGWEKYMGF